MTNLNPAQQLAVQHGRLFGDIVWVPGVYVEDDDAARRALVAEYGPSVPSGYMSEECGWRVDDDLVIAAVKDDDDDAAVSIP